jgi:hypothetical protein
MRDKSAQSALDSTLTATSKGMLAMYMHLWRRPLSPDELAHASKVFEELEDELRSLARG